MTKKEMFARIAEVCSADAEIVNFCNHEVELLNKKKGSSKPTKVQRENEEVKNAIADVLAKVEEPITVTEIAKMMDKEFTNQKISALLRQMVEAGRVVKTIEKKVSRFALA